MSLQTLTKMINTGAKSLKLNKVQAKVMPAGETAFLSMKKVKRTLPSQMIEVRIA